MGYNPSCAHLSYDITSTLHLMKHYISPRWSFASCLVFSPLAVHAASQNWLDAGPSNLWSTSAANWDAGSSWANANDAVFSGAGETVEIEGAVTFRNLTFRTGGYTIIDANNNGTLSLSAAGTISTATGTTTFSENIGGSFGLTKTGAGTLVLSGTNTYSGSTTVSDGKLTLNFGLISSNVLNSSTSLVLGGGALELSSSPLLGLNSQTFASTSLTAGTASQVIMTQNGLGTLGLTLGAITRGAQSTVDFSGSGVTSSPAAGLSAAMVRSSEGQAYATVNGGADWAGKGALSSSIVAFGSVGSYANSTAGGFTGNSNIDIASGIDTTVSSNTSVTTLRFNVNQARTVTVNSGINLTLTGGILVTNNSNNSGGTTFTGGNLRAGSTAMELVVHHYGSGGLTIGSAIVDSTGGASSLTLAGTGVTKLTGSNTFTGATSVQGGTLEVTSSATFNSVTTVNEGATLAGDGTYGSQVTVAGVLTPGSTAGDSTGTVSFSNGLSLAASGSMNWQLNANSETAGGSISDQAQVNGGAFALANGAVLNVAFGGTVDFSQAFWDSSREWLMVDLNGATDSTSGRTFTLGSLTGGSGDYTSEGNFAAINRSGEQVLTWTPNVVPEPSAALLIASTGLVLLRRRR
jgi:fibronectin-binding autotransporter adhesin